MTAPQPRPPQPHPPHPRQSQPHPPAPGSPPAATSEVFAGVDIGGTTTQVVLCTPELDVVDSQEVPTPAAEGGTAMVGAALDALGL
ncbi:hypothetical protein AB0H92_50125, partial [Streptomyces phaeochromogenes]